MRIKIDTDELIKQEVISTATATDIHQYYKNKSANSNRVLVVFGSLGALLVGLGIILIIGHNWDDLSRTTKSILSFLPLVIGQACCLFTLIKKPDSGAWREGSSLFLSLAVGASISLISQIYHIDGNWKDFVFTWSLLVLPVIYLLRSSGTFFIYIMAITSYAFSKFSFFRTETPYIYWGLLAAVIPYFIMEVRRNASRNVIGFYNWFIAISASVTLFLFFDRHNEEMMILGYLLLGLIFIAVGKMKIFESLRTFKNAFLPVGIFGFIMTLFFLSSKYIVNDLCREEAMGIINFEIETVGCLILSVIGLAITWLANKNQKLQVLLTIAIVGSWALFYISSFEPMAYLLTNILLFVGSIALIYTSTKTDKISLFNLGMIIISALIYIRFLDSDFSFLAKGITFILLGIGFFVANVIFTKNIRNNEK